MTPEPRGLYVDLLPPVEPDLRLAATLALNAKVLGTPGAAETIEAFRERFHAETGISHNLLHLLIADKVLP